MREEVEVTREGVHIDVDVLRYEGTAFEVAKRLFEAEGLPVAEHRIVTRGFLEGDIEILFRLTDVFADHVQRSPEGIGDRLRNRVPVRRVTTCEDHQTGVTATDADTSGDTGTL